MANPAVTNRAKSLREQQKKEISRRDSVNETPLDVRFSRQGYRGLGFYQLSRYWGGDGFLTVGMNRCRY